MVTTRLAERTVEIPTDVNIELSGRTVKVTGPRGTLQEDLSHLPVNLDLQDKRLRVAVAWPRKREYAMTGTAAAHVRNMIKGVTEGFRYKLKMVHAHFPMTVKVRQDQRLLFIENFTGEKSPRVVRIVGDVTVKVAEDEITVEGSDLKNVSQTASNIESATKIKDKDQRVFLDGIYIFEKA
jgi:large subunit ribosomal protein L6